MATHSSILAWRIHGQRNVVDSSPWGHNWSDWACTHYWVVYAKPFISHSSRGWEVPDQGADRFSSYWEPCHQFAGWTPSWNQDCREKYQQPLICRCVHDQSCPTLCDPMNRGMPGLPIHHQLPEFTQTHVHRVGDASQPSHPLSSPCPPAPNPSQHQSLFQWVNSSHNVAKVLEFQETF